MLQIILIAIIINSLSDNLISKNYYLNNDFLHNFKDLKDKKEILNLTLTLFLLFTILTIICYVIVGLFFFYFQKFKILLLIMPFFFLNGFLKFFLNIYKSKFLIYSELTKYLIFIIIIFKFFEKNTYIIIYLFLLTYLLEILVNYFLFVKKFNLRINLGFKKDYRRFIFIRKFIKNLIYKQEKKVAIILFAVFYIIFLQFRN
jgi:hypothetical protein